MNKIVPLIVTLAPALCLAKEGSADSLVSAIEEAFCLFIGIFVFAFVWIFIKISFEWLWEKTSRAGKIIIFGIPAFTVVSLVTYWLEESIRKGNYAERNLAYIIIAAIVIFSIYLVVRHFICKWLENRRKKSIFYHKPKKEKWELPGKIYHFLFKE